MNAMNFPTDNELAGVLIILAVILISLIIGVAFIFTHVLFISGEIKRKIEKQEKNLNREN
jgi:hypothetical protein